MHIFSCYGHFSGRKGYVPERVALPPPVYSAAAFGGSSKSSTADTLQYSSSSYYDYTAPAATAPSAPSSNYEHQVNTCMPRLLTRTYNIYIFR